MAKPILITGATGFLGKHLVSQLRDKEDCPTLRIFNYGPCPYRDQPGFEVIDGDIMSIEEVAAAMEGCGQVYHLAGRVSRDPKDDYKMYDIHVGGTRNVCEAAVKHRPEKMVFVSSAGTIACSADSKVWDETSPYPSDTVAHWAYYTSKIHAEKMSLDYVRWHKLPIVITNPALLLGPGDELGSSTGDVKLFMEGNFKGIPGGGMCIVDARDVATGLILAMERGRAGERYLLGGENMTFEEMAQKLSQVTGIRAPSLKPSLAVSRLSTKLFRKLLPLCGKPFDLDDISVIMSYHFWYCDSSKAEKELGFRARDSIETFRDTVEDLKKRLA